MSNVCRGHGKVEREVRGKYRSLKRVRVWSDSKRDMAVNLILFRRKKGRLGQSVCELPALRQSASGPREQRGLLGEEYRASGIALPQSERTLGP